MDPFYVPDDDIEHQFNNSFLKEMQKPPKIEPIIKENNVSQDLSYQTPTKVLKTSEPKTPSSQENRKITSSQTPQIEFWKMLAEVPLESEETPTSNKLSRSPRSPTVLRESGSTTPMRSNSLSHTPPSQLHQKESPKQNSRINISITIPEIPLSEPKEQEMLLSTDQMEELFTNDSSLLKNSF